MSTDLVLLLDCLEIWLSKSKIYFRRDFSLAKLSQIKCGGIPRLLVMPKNLIELQILIDYLETHKIPRVIIGNLSNLLIRSGDIKTVMISLKQMKEIVFGTNDVKVDAGVLIPSLARLMESKGYSGFSGLYGVPATLGGAVFMNASCYGDETALYLIDVTCLNNRGHLCTLPKKELNFGWRYSAFHDDLRNYTIVGARFALISNPSGSQEKLKLSAAEINRRTYQESEYPNLGSLFATRNIYMDLARDSVLYNFLYICVKVLLRVMPGERNLNAAILFVSLTRAFFQIKNHERIALSSKTINCVVNLGGAQADEIICYVKQVRAKMGNRLPFEIEILEDLI